MPPSYPLTQGSVVKDKLINSAVVNNSRAAKMMEVDENGWSHIHQAAKKGYFKSVEKFIKQMSSQLEFETQDGLNETPLLIATRVGIDNVDTVDVLISLGANMLAVNTQNHGIVEICCIEGHTDLLEHLVNVDHKDVPVWKKILKFCTSTEEDEAESAARSLSVMSQPTEDGSMNPNWRPIFDHGAINILLNVIKSDIGDRARAQAIQCFINLLHELEVKDQFVAIGAVDIFIKQLKSANGRIVQLASTAFSILCTVKKYAELAANQGIIPALVKVLTAQTESEVLVEAVKAIGVVCDYSETRQSMFNSTSEGIESLCTLVKNAFDSELILALNIAITKIVRRHEVNQNAFVDGGATINIVSLIHLKNKEIQLSAVDTVHMLVEGNPYTQKMFIQEGAIAPLMTLLKRSKTQLVQEKTASSLWALAGSDGEDRRAMGRRIQVKQLVDFLASLSETLKYIGSEALGVLAQGAHNSQDEIAEANGVNPVVRLLKEEKEYLVLSAIRTLRHMCLSVGYIPHKQNQGTVLQARGLKYLIALLMLSKSELIQVESALTLASVALGNQEVLQEIWSSSSNLQFEYVKVLKLLYSTDDVVKLLAGSAIATFAYNSMAQQQALAAEGGVRFSCFLEFLQSDDEFFRCSAAFQIIVLAKVIPDEEQAVVTAAGIKLLVDILFYSRSPVIQALAADCVARLAHTRTGIPSAFVAIDTVKKLCELMLSEHPQVRGCAAIALAFLSFNHKAERELLNKCRVDPYLIKCLLHYTEKYKISPQFLDEWRHYKRIGLPPIREGRPALVSQDNYHQNPVTAPTRPGDATRNGESKSNAAHSSSPMSMMEKSNYEDIETKSRTSRVEHNSYDTFSEKSRSHSVSVE